VAENPPITREADLEERLYALEKLVMVLAGLEMGTGEATEDPTDYAGLYRRLRQSTRSYEMRKAAEHHQIEIEGEPE